MTENQLRVEMFGVEREMERLRSRAGFLAARLALLAARYRPGDLVEYESVGQLASGIILHASTDFHGKTTYTIQRKYKGVVPRAVDVEEVEEDKVRKLYEAGTSFLPGMES